jgi:Family of unknown function (DUF5681)
MPQMPFEPGISGNPAGKPKGTRNKTTLAVEALLDGEAETLTRKAIELAKAGDLAALRVCLDRIAPPRKDRPVLFELPPVSSAADAAIAAAALLEAVAVGDLTPAEASELGKLIEAYVKALEATDFAEPNAGASFGQHHFQHGLTAPSGSRRRSSPFSSIRSKA